MPYAFTTRSWELIHSYSVDILDSLGSAIRSDIAMNRVVRILPSPDEFVNEEWITDRARFVYDSFTVQRAFFPVIRLCAKLVNVS